MTMNLHFSFEDEHKQDILVKGNCYVKEVILNRPNKLNTLNYKMVSKLTKILKRCEDDSIVKLIILKGNGRAFCAGGDMKSLVMTSIVGHWSSSARYYAKALILSHLIYTYTKPLVFLIDGTVMGAGAGYSMNGTFRIVTEKAVFAMPEASIGLFPDIGASHFLSKLPGFLGEYIGLSGVRLDGRELIACGLATHFVPSQKLRSLENALLQMTSLDTKSIETLINSFAENNVKLKQDSPLSRLEKIKACYSRDAVEEIIASLQSEIERGAEKWMVDAVNYMHSVSPSSLKIFLRSVREGRGHTLEKCLLREYNIACHIIRRSIGSDFYEGSRAKLLDRDNKPKWNPSRLELVSKEMVNRYFMEVDDEDWEPLQFLTISKRAFVSKM